ncbi:hypothetical protein Tsubulata_023549 [Turnera subulata]|uniref:Zinc knuckle CX2CX4HX4C domain-containing protein n=1 Tax=Turnera subulata TaxID=218843 RepID=A0A9Q0F1K3_9ROSI|nr:hypothetical protein Tsubulata_023549 [Turnera subulata]
MPLVLLWASYVETLGSYGFVCLKIEFLPEHPLVPGLHVFDEPGQKHWLKIKYEHLGELCYRCGRITHTTRKSTRPRRQDEGVELESVLSVGPWIRAREVVGKYYPEKKQNNGEDTTGKEKESDPEDLNDEHAHSGEVDAKAAEAISQEPQEEQQPTIRGDTTSKKRKVPDDEVRRSAEIIAKRVHQGWIELDGGIGPRNRQ